jgi:hypothetical protein
VLGQAIAEHKPDLVVVAVCIGLDRLRKTRLAEEREMPVSEKLPA